MESTVGLRFEMRTGGLVVFFFSLQPCGGGGGEVFRVRKGFYIDTVVLEGDEELETGGIVIEKRGGMNGKWDALS